MAYVPSRKPKPLPKRKTRHLDAPKPPWDDSVTDLDSYRPSNEELLRRKQVTKPADNSRDQLKSRFLSGDKKFANSAVLREILFAHNNIEDVLAESDKTMSLVHDLFGENPGKYSGISTVTPAPGFGESRNHGFSRFPQTAMPPTHDDTSENELQMTDLSNDDATFTESHDVLSGVSRSNNNFDSSNSLLDLQRYKKLLEKTENDLRKLNNGVLKPSQLQSLNTVQDALSSSGDSFEHGNNPVTNSTRKVITRAACNDEAPSVENTGDMKVILGAIEELKTAVLNISQDNKSVSNRRTGNRVGNNSAAEYGSQQSNQSSQISAGNSELTQLSNLKNLMPLLAQRSCATSNSQSAPENTCSNTTFSEATLQKCQVNDVSSTSTDLHCVDDALVASVGGGELFDIKSLKTFDQIVSAVKYLSDEQASMKRKVNERDCLIKKLQQNIERQNATIRALAEDIIQLQMVMSQWSEVHTAGSGDQHLKGDTDFHFNS